MEILFDDDSRKRVLIVAEIGKNFIQTEEDRSVLEYLENAKALILAAKEAGADAVKFQTHTVEDEQIAIDVVSPHFLGADRYSWVLRNTRSTPFDDFWSPLKEYCDRIGVVFFSTPMSRGAAVKLKPLNVPFWKVGSGDLLDFVMLDYLASMGKPVIISSGMSTLQEIDSAMDFLRRRRVKTILMHCVSKYPCPPADLRLSTIGFLRERYGVPIGFSDHSLGYESAVAASVLGASIIEKHFSFSRDLWGADHKVSMTPDEFRAMVAKIRALEKEPAREEARLKKKVVKESLGSGAKVLQKGEVVFRPYFRKSLMVARDIPAGTVIDSEMLYAMRPQIHAGGLPSERYEEVLGRISARVLKKYEPLTEDCFVQKVL